MLALTEGSSLTVRADQSAAAITGPQQVDFGTQIEPLLTRFGCNAGGCHGKASGQNGFKLSLFGFDTNFDYEAIVEEARGRRIFGSAAENSLLIMKATGKVPHGGGKRIDPGTEPYQILCSWITQGAPA
ncbi:MAG TPA: S-layer protein, partial [Planctomycetaceae bacterium]